MKIIATLVCLLVVTASFAQQNSVKGKSDSLQNQTIDNMPVLEGRGTAFDMPTRTGKGDAIPMPNRVMPVPMIAQEQVATSLKALEEPLKHWPADSINWLNPSTTLPGKKK